MTQLNITNLKKFFSNTYQYYIIIFLMGFVAFISTQFLFKQSIRLDESQSIWQTAHTPSKIIGIIAKDVHLPLYHFMLYAWQNFFGNGVIATRSLSLMFYLISIPAFYLLSSYAFNRKIAIYAVTLFAISPFFNWYGNEVRMYSLLTLVTILNQYFFLRIYKIGGRGSFIGYLITALFGIYSHYFFTLNLLSQAVFYLYYRKQFKQGTFGRLFSIAGLLAIAYLPWLSLVYSLGSASNSQPLLHKPSSIDLFNSYSQYIFGFQTDSINTAILSTWPILVIVIFLFLNGKSMRINRTILFFIISSFLPIITVFIESRLVRPIFVARYLIFALPPLFLSISWLFNNLPKPLLVALKATLIFFMLSGLSFEVFSQATPVKENYLGASEYLTSHASYKDVIVLSAPFSLYPFQYSYRGSTLVSTLPIWDNKKGGIPPFEESKLPQEVETLSAFHKKAWVLLSYNQGYESTIKNYYDSHYNLESTVSFSKDVNLYEYTLPRSYQKDN